MNGNVQQWVLDDYDESGLGCLRGASWADENADGINLTKRYSQNKNTAYKVFGFRCVIAPINQVSKIPTKTSEDGINDSSSATESSNQLPNGVKEFFEKWLNDHTSNNPNDIANNFADEALYCYANGYTNRQFIYEDFFKLIKKYPIRSYNNINVYSVDIQSPECVNIKYNFYYQYKGQKRASGFSDVDITIQNTGGKWLITKFYETVNRH
jgi:hypothetical protein